MTNPPPTTPGSDPQPESAGQQPSWSPPSAEPTPPPPGAGPPPARPTPPAPASGGGPAWSQPTTPAAPGYGAGSAWSQPTTPTGYGPPPSGAPGQPPAYAAAAQPARTGVVPLRPLTLGEILDGAFRAVRHNPKMMFGLAIAVVTVTVTVQTLLQWYLQGLLAAEFSGALDALDPTAGAELTSATAATTAQLITTIPTFGIAIAILTGVLIVSVSRSVIGERATGSEVWARVKGHIGGLIGFSFLLSVALAVFTGLWAVGIFFAITNEQIALFFVVLLVGGLALLVGSVWLAIRTLLVPAVLVLEDRKLFGGIARGWRLTRGSFWRLLGIYLVVSIIVGVVASLVYFPATVVNLIFFDVLDYMATGPLLVNAVFSVIAMTITTVFMAATIALLYIDVRMRREGLDVALSRAVAERS